MKPQEAAKTAQRALRVYAFDPSRGARLDNLLTIRVPNESLQPGPIGEKIAVIDYDASNRCYYDPVDLDTRDALGEQGLAPSESNPKFHQQMVYAVVMETIRRFETSLGRPVRWYPDNSPSAHPLHKRLRIYPHAMQEANAFYDRKLRALLFGYFKAADEDAGANLPGQIVFTCLSHDIIVHETTHAILDGIRSHFNEPTSRDAAAFHEGFADIVALLQHFSFKETLLDTIQRTGGLIHRRQLAPDASPDVAGALIQAEVGEDNPMVDLARQFGEAMGHRRALRNALGTRPDPRLLDATDEPHERGAILVAAVFDAFFSIYIRRTRDLIRMAYPDGRAIVPNFLHADLANRLAEEAARTATNIQNICIRALDYCPPVDITFGDYLRALVTADCDAMTDDSFGYRAALINAFRARGIRPEGVISYSEDALAWDRYRGQGLTDADPNFQKLWRLIADYEDDPTREARDNLYEGLWNKVQSYAPQLGLSGKYKFQPKSLYTLHQIRPDGKLERRIVAEIVQTRKKNGEDKFDFRGGTTLIISREGELLYSISKPIEGKNGERRLKQQRKYLGTMANAFPLAAHLDFDAQADTALRGIHRGY